ncbi:MAG: 30S ribosomal protein S15 [Nitrososphaerales archaeon]
MARMHSHRKGKSHSTRPLEISPSWVSMSKEEIISLIIKMAKEGLDSSEIGVRLRDEYGIPLVKPIIGKSILDILQENNLLGDMPEDLEILVKKAMGLQKHLKLHRGDRLNVRSLELLEAKIHRLQRYYKSKGRLPQNWKYSAVVAKLE